VIAYSPIPTVAEFHQSRSRVKVLWGGLGTGKTTAGLWEYVLQCMESSIPLDGMVIRSSYRELRDTTLKTFMRWFGDVARWRESDSLATIRLPSANNDGSVLEHILRFRSLERPDDAKKVQSWEGAFVLLDEVVPAFSTSGRLCEGIPLEIVEYTNARLRHTWAGQESARYTQVLVANPPPPSHWLYEHFLNKPADELARRKGGVSVFFVRKEENEAHLPKDYYAFLCDAFHDPDLVRRFVEGEIVAVYSGVSVFPEARDKVHITSERLKPFKDAPLILGFDYGLTPATLITQILPNGQWRWLSEVQSFNHAFDVHLDALRTHLHDHYPGYEYRCWGDPSGATPVQTDERTCVELAAKAGFEIKPGRQDWQSRKEAIKQRLLRNSSDGGPALFVSRAGAPLAAEALTGGYRYPKSASGEVGTRPIKSHPFSDLMDCAQYIATREFSLSAKVFKPESRDGEWIRVKPANPFRPVVSSRQRRGSWLSR
jgi:hypothetical protein